MMKFILASATCFAISSVLSAVAFNHFPQVISLWTICITLITGLCVLVNLLLGGIFLFVSTQPVSRFTSFGSSLFHVFTIVYVNVSCERAVVDFEDKCKHPREAQEESLKYILQRLKSTALYKDKGLAEVKTLDDLRRKVSLTSYNDYLNYVDRMTKGERDVMVTGIPDRFILTSGTTGKGKLFPCKSHMEMFMISSKMIPGIGRRCFPRLSHMRPRLFFYCLPTLTKTECDIDVTPMGYMDEKQRRLMHTNVTPCKGYAINTTHEALYIQLLFGLRDKDVGIISAILTTSLVEAMQLLEKNWLQLVKDIEVGNIDPSLSLTPDLRQSLTKSLGGGHKDRADELRREFEKGFDGIMKRVWPNVELITAVDIQGIKEKLMETYCQGITIHSHVYGGSEGMYGINMDPFTVTPEYTLAFYTNLVFEFIPEKDIDASDPTTCFANEVDVGKRYEIVITQFNGLCRYRVGDVVEIIGHFYKCPKMKFVYRCGSLLNMCGEKVSSDITKGAVKDAFISKYPHVSVNYQTVAESGLILGADIEESKGAHYIFFVEVEGGDDPTEIDKSVIAESIDANLYERHRFYRNFKDTRQIHLSSVYFVHPGSFNKLKDYIIANSSASANQFKMPEKLRTVGMFETLFNCRVR